jgi:DNA polymerase III epsilon subunit-like protein
MYLYTGIQTTGLDFEKDDIVRLSFIIEDSGFNIITSGTFECTPRPGRFPSDISEDALRFNKLTIEDLRKFQSPSEACSKFLEILEGDKYTYIGHYKDFDLSFIGNFLKMYSDKNINEYLKETVDIMDLAKIKEFQNKQRYFDNYRLKTLTGHFNISYDTSDIESKVSAVRNLKHRITEF